MKLKTARVQNFKSVEDSGVFTLDSITCLAGKNESGKTALLQALAHLKPLTDDYAEFDVTMDFPRRHRREFDPDNPANVLTTTWELEAPDIEAVEAELGQGAVASSEITVTKGYGGDRKWSVQVDESAFVAHLVKGHSELNTTQRERAVKQSSIAQLVKVLTGLGATRSQTESALLEQATQLPQDHAITAARKILAERLPHFLYFDTYEKLDGTIPLDDLAGRITAKNPLRVGERIFLALLALAGTSLEELRESGRAEELIAELEAASIAVSDEIFEYWSQNRHLQVEARIDSGLPEDPPPLNEGSIFRLRIRNLRHRVTVTFDERSAGFVWFFSFLVWFSQMRKNYGDRLVILLDEPGLNLHARAQADLLRYMREQLEPAYQVIYTTHSPFMIDPARILAVRTVEDVERDGRLEGTKVGDDVLSTDADTLFPLRAALGYEITQTLFIGENSLIVEGPSDFLYLRWASNELSRLGRSGLDPRWTITPAGGIDKIPSFVALFGATLVRVATLTDYHHGDKAKIERLRASDLLAGGHIFTAEQFTEQTEADLEDLLGRALYVPLVHLTYGLAEADQLPAERPEGAPNRVVEEVEDHLRTANVSGPQFDHYAPAAYLAEHPEQLRSGEGYETAMGRFEALFQALNGLL